MFCIASLTTLNLFLRITSDEISDTRQHRDFLARFRLLVGVCHVVVAVAANESSLRHVLECQFLDGKLSKECEPLLLFQLDPFTSVSNCSTAGEEHHALTIIQYSVVA